MTVKEQGDLLESSSQLDCQGCIERDLEIARLNERLQQGNSAAISWSLIVLGWLLMVCIPIVILSWLGKALLDGNFTFEELVYSPGLIVSMFLFPFSLIPIVALIHWQSKIQRVVACCISTVGLWAVWSRAPTYSEGLDFLSELTEYAALIPVGVVFAMLPMLVMKLWKRWKFVSRDHDRIGSDPSISTILLVTTLVAASLYCFEFVDLNSYYEDMSTWQKFSQLIGLVGLPAMAIGAFLVVSFFCVLRKTRPRNRVLLLAGSIAVATVVAASSSLLLNVALLDAIEVRWMFWLKALVPGLVCSVAWLVIGMLSAYYLRLLGYRLWTLDDVNG